MGHFKSLPVLAVFFCLILVCENKTVIAQQGREKVYSLSLGDVTRLALENSFDIQLAKYDVWIARTDQAKAESIYDTVLNAQIEYQNDQSKTSSTIAGTKTIDNDYNIGLSKKLPSGTTIGIDLKNNRHRTNSIFTSSPLTHDSTLGFIIEQELGRNFFGFQDRGDIKVTRIDIENAEYTSLKKIEGYISQVQKAYWDLVLQIENVKIQESMVDQARRLYDLHREKLKDGLVERPEAIASEANYKKRQNDLILDRNRVETKANILKLFLNIEGQDVRIEPTQDFEPSGTRENLGQALKNAFEHRRDYKRTVNAIKSKNITLSMKKNNMWPEINLTASFDRNGLGDHFKKAVTQITDEDNPDLFAGLTISFPLENRDARAQLKAAELEKARALLELKLLERRIAVDIVDQVRDCNVFQELLANSEEIADLEAWKLKEEEKRFKFGRSDTDTLIRFQEDSLKAEGEALEAKHRYYTALVDLRQKSGILLDDYWEGEL